MSSHTISGITHIAIGAGVGFAVPYLTFLSFGLTGLGGLFAAYMGRGLVSGSLVSFIQSLAMTWNAYAIDLERIWIYYWNNFVRKEIIA